MVHDQIKCPSNKPDANVKKNTGHPFALSEIKDLYVWVFFFFYITQSFLSEPTKLITLNCFW